MNLIQYLAARREQRYQASRPEPPASKTQYKQSRKILALLHRQPRPEPGRDIVRNYICYLAEGRVTISGTRAEVERKLGRETRDYETWQRAYTDWVKRGERIRQRREQRRARVRRWLRFLWIWLALPFRLLAVLGEVIIDLLPELAGLGLFGLIVFADIALMLASMIFLGL